MDFESFTKTFTNNPIPHNIVGSTVYTEGEVHGPQEQLLYAHTRLGTIKGNHFKPGLPLLDLIAKQTKRIAIINEKSSWLFICGKNVLKEGIEKCEYKEGLVIVLNEKEEVLGYGSRQGAGITNLLDKGDYLRRER